MVYENKELGLLVADNEDEQMWIDIKRETEQDILKLKKMLKFQEAVLSLAISKIAVSNEKS
jgi:hypothetical protein